eukprot:12562491-Ditylum_brightwellii.AAC.2
MQSTCTPDFNLTQEFPTTKQSRELANVDFVGAYTKENSHDPVSDPDQDVSLYIGTAQSHGS